MRAPDRPAVSVRFAVDDPGHRLAGVRLWQDLGLPADSVDFARTAAGWELELAQPPVRRMEYLLELHHPDGSEELVRDPANPGRVSGAFGEHSVLEFAGYLSPWWLVAETIAASRTELDADGVAVTLWSPSDAGPDEALPLLAAHDGPELDAYARITGYAGALIAAGALTRHRLALLAPSGPKVGRNERYAASEAYATTLAGTVLPAIRAAVAVRGPVALAGVSLGALAAVHCEWRHPGTFGGLFCQSGSFFTPELDPQERGYPWFGRITAFTAEVMKATQAPSRPQVAMTCGATEENAANNRLMATRLRALGCGSTLAEFADMHNFTAWRDALDPHLTGLLQRVWGGAG
jgi:enterochelin esterase-like enzyme